MIWFNKCSTILLIVVHDSHDISINSISLKWTLSSCDSTVFQPGDKVMVIPSLSDEEANKLFPNGFTTKEVPSGKKYLRYTQPWSSLARQIALRWFGFTHVSEIACILLANQAVALIIIHNLWQLERCIVMLYPIHVFVQLTIKLSLRLSIVPYSTLGEKNKSLHRYSSCFSGSPCELWQVWVCVSLL